MLGELLFVGLAHRVVSGRCVSGCVAGRGFFPTAFLRSGSVCESRPVREPIDRLVHRGKVEGRGRSGRLALLLRGAKCCRPFPMSGGHGLAAVGCSSACYDGGNLRCGQASCLRCDLACRSAVLARVASMATAGQSFDCAHTAHTRLTATPASVATPSTNAGLLLLAAVLLKAASRGKIVCQQKRFLSRPIQSFGPVLSYSNSESVKAHSSPAIRIIPSMVPSSGFTSP